MGLEPTTFCLEGRSSSQLSYTRFFMYSIPKATKKPYRCTIYNKKMKANFKYLNQPNRKWSWRRDLNSQPSAYKAGALPLSYASFFRK